MIIGWRIVPPLLPRESSIRRRKEVRYIEESRLWVEDLRQSTVPPSKLYTLALCHDHLNIFHLHCWSCTSPFDSIVYTRVLHFFTRKIISITRHVSSENLFVLIKISISFVFKNLHVCSKLAKSEKFGEKNRGCNNDIPTDPTQPFVSSSREPQFLSPILLISHHCFYEWKSHSYARYSRNSRESKEPDETKEHKTRCEARNDARS